MTTRYLVLAALAVWSMSMRTHYASASRTSASGTPASRTSTSRTFASRTSAGRAQTNNPPVVRIESPAAGSTVSAAGPVRYEITVADKEDGDSRYDEINPKEVVLEIRAAARRKSLPSPATPASPSSTTARRANPASSTPLQSPGLAVMARSNCFNCHQFNGKGIGPSLADIARRYQNTTATTDTLSKRVKDGSSGTWGKEKMPSHPEVTMADIRTMVQWIEKYAAAPGVTYQNGTTGVLQFPSTPGSKPPGTPTPGIYTLTAAYTDHGTAAKTGPYLTGLDHLTLTVK